MNLTRVLLAAVATVALTGMVTTADAASAQEKDRFALPSLPDVAEITLKTTADGKPIIPYCTGTTAGPYDRLSRVIGALGEESGVVFTPVAGHGTWGNFASLAKGECLWAPVQPNGLIVLDRVDTPLSDKLSSAGILHQEPVIVLARRTGTDIDNLDDLQDDSYSYGIVGGPEGGTNVFLNEVIGRDDDYALPLPRYYATLQEAVANLKAGKVDVVVSVQGLSGQALKDVNDQYGKDVRIVPADDSDFLKATWQRNGQKPYRWIKLPGTEVTAQLMKWNADASNPTMEWTVASPATIAYRSDLPPNVTKALLNAIGVIEPLWQSYGLPEGVEFQD